MGAVKPISSICVHKNYGSVVIKRAQLYIKKVHLHTVLYTKRAQLYIEKVHPLMLHTHEFYTDSNVIYRWI